MPGDVAARLGAGMTRLSPERNAELRRLHDIANRADCLPSGWDEDSLAIEFEDAGAALILAAVDALPDLLAAAAERDAMRSTLARLLDGWSLNEDGTHWEYVGRASKGTVALTDAQAAVVQAIREGEGRDASLPTGDRT